MQFVDEEQEDGKEEEKEPKAEDKVEEEVDSNDLFAMLDAISGAPLLNLQVKPVLEKSDGIAGPSSLPSEEQQEEAQVDPEFKVLVEIFN